MVRLHPAQLRLLSFLAHAPAGSFVTLAQIEKGGHVRPEDDLFIPSLVACGWAEMGPVERPSVRITDAGHTLLSNPEVTILAKRWAR